MEHAMIILLAIIITVPAILVAGKIQKKRKK